MKVIGKKSAQPAVSAICGLIFAAIATPLWIHTISAVSSFSGLMYAILAIFYAILVWMIIYNGYFFITLPQNIIILNEESGEVTVYLSRNKKESFNVSDIKEVYKTRPVIFITRVTAHVMIETERKRVRARFIVNPDGAIYALLNK